MDLPYDDEIVHNAKDRAPSPRPLSADHPDMEEGECEDVDFDASEVVNNNVNTMVGNTVNNNCTTSPRKKRARHESKSNNINNAVGTRPTRQSEGNNNVQLQYQALPVDHAYDPARDGPPLDGAQYLAGVR